ncbi:MAG TPA: galactokinase [Actinomycetota bacterium]|nr:galactokinase [Actinomycetota bacterium]HRV65088.1 galactokinase [Candidatus Nanopelagicales bacterium]
MRQFHAPGRVNLIGDHIDYMGGTVLPMAIDRGTDLWVEARSDRRIVAVSDNFSEVGEVVADIDAQQARPEWEWVNYLVGVAYAFRARGVELPGVDVRVRGNIPNGAGLSSSASLELAMAVAFDALVGAGSTAAELALVGQSAENDFIGVACGIMDQLCIAGGVAGHALLIDCGALGVTPVRFPCEIAVVVANTNQRRELSDSAYNERRSACETAQEMLGVRLVDIPADQVSAAIVDLPESLRPRARHVITEQARVWSFADALQQGDLVAAGNLMRASHESLRDDFEVTGPALDTMVEAAWEAPGVIGARMTGAGFGGCTVNLVEPDAVDAFTQQVGDVYRRSTGLPADFYVVSSADGAREVMS